MGCANYKQTDPRWSNIKYAGDRVYGSGCGATALANIIYSKDPTITPKEVATWLEANGQTANGQGTYWGGIVKGAEHFGMKCTMLGSGLYGCSNTSYEQEWKSKMKSGKYYGILLMGRSIFTTGGHYITACSYDGTYVDIHDPYSVNQTKKHTWGDFNAKVKVFYLIEKPTTYKAKGSTYLYTKACTGSYISKVSKGTNITLISDLGKGMSKVNVNNKVGYIYNNQFNSKLSKCKSYRLIHNTYVYGTLNKNNKMQVDKKTKTKVTDIGRRGTLYSYGTTWARIEYQGKTKWILKKRIKML